MFIKLNKTFNKRTKLSCLCLFYKKKVILLLGVSHHLLRHLYKLCRELVVLNNVIELNPFCPQVNSLMRIERFATVKYLEKVLYYSA